MGLFVDHTLGADEFTQNSYLGERGAQAITDLIAEHSFAVAGALLEDMIADAIYNLAAEAFELAVTRPEFKTKLSFLSMMLKSSFFCLFSERSTPSWGPTSPQVD